MFAKDATSSSVLTQCRVKRVHSNILTIWLRRVLVALSLFQLGRGTSCSCSKPIAQHPVAVENLDNDSLASTNTCSTVRTIHVSCMTCSLRVWIVKTRCLCKLCTYSISSTPSLKLSNRIDESTSPLNVGYTSVPSIVSSPTPHGI